MFDADEPNQPTSNILKRPPNQLHDVSTVCSYWRAIVTNIPRLWSLITFSEPGGFDRAALWLQRAGESLLSIEMNTRHLEMPDPHIHIPIQLKPYMKRVDSLTLEAPVNVMGPIIGCWLDSSSTLVTSLQLAHPMKGRTESYCLDSTQTTSERLNQLLLSIITLRLHGVYFDWDWCHFGSLTTLEFAFLHSERSPRLSQLIRILSASPMLRTFYLVSTTIYPEESAQYEVESLPISLPFLETLEFSTISGNLYPLISLLHAGTRPLELRINISGPNSTAEHDAITSFLARSSVKTLYIGTHASNCYQWFPYLPQLETLYLVEQRATENIWNAISPVLADGTTQDGLNCLKLRTIGYQSYNWLRTDNLQRLLESHSIQSFKVSKRFAEHTRFGSNRLSFSEWMSKVAPNVTVSAELGEDRHHYGFVPYSWW